MVQAATVTEFSYMAAAETNLDVAAPALSTDDEHEVLSSTVPAGMAVIDTGCTASVIGATTAKRYAEFLRGRGLPELEAIMEGVRWCSLNSSEWTFLAGEDWPPLGQVTTYVVPCLAPFLLSRPLRSA